MARRPHKYKAQETTCNHGCKHPSAREARRCNELALLERGGAISDLIRQPQFWFEIGGNLLRHENGRRVGVKLDFQYIERGKIVVEDSKGMTVRDWPLRKAVFRALYPDLELREV